MQNLHRLGEDLQVDPLLQCFVNFPLVSRHFSAGATVDNSHFAGAQAHSRARRVDGRVPAADDHHPFAQTCLLAQGYSAQEWHTVKDALRFILTRDAQLLRLVGADGQKDRSKAFVEQFVHISNGVVELKGHPQFQNLVNLIVEHLARQAIGGNAHPGHAPGHWQGLVDSDLVAHPRQKVGGGEPRWAGSHHCHPAHLFGRQFSRCLWIRPQFPVSLFPRFLALLVPFLINSVGHEPLESTDGHRAVQLASVALGFARVVADAAHGRWEGIVLLDDLQCLFVTLLGDQGDVALGARVGWAGSLAGTCAFLGNDISTGDSLRIGLVGGRPCG